MNTKYLRLLLFFFIALLVPAAAGVWAQPAVKKARYYLHADIGRLLQFAEKKVINLEDLPYAFTLQGAVQFQSIDQAEFNNALKIAKNLDLLTLALEMKADQLADFPVSAMALLLTFREMTPEIRAALDGIITQIEAARRMPVLLDQDLTVKVAGKQFVLLLNPKSFGLNAASLPAAPQIRAALQKDLKPVSDQSVVSMSYQADPDYTLSMLGRSDQQGQMLDVNKLLHDLQENPYIKAAFAANEATAETFMGDGFTVKSESFVEGEENIRRLVQLNEAAKVGMSLFFSIVASIVGMEIRSSYDPPTTHEAAEKSRKTKAFASGILKNLSKSTDRIKIEATRNSVRSEYELFTAADLAYIRNELAARVVTNRRDVKKYVDFREQYSAVCNLAPRKKTASAVQQVDDMLINYDSEFDSFIQYEYCGGFANIALSLLAKGYTREAFAVYRRFMFINKGQTDEQGRNLVHWAAIRKAENFFPVFAERNDSYAEEAEDNAGKTPVIYAIEAQSLPIVSALLEAGVTVSTPVDKKNKPVVLSAAEKTNNKKIIELIKNKIKQEAEQNSGGY